MAGATGASPLVAEAIAIDTTNALRAAEVGLRSFRSRPLLRRLWEIGSGQGDERLSAIGSDLVTVQRATLSLVTTLLREEIRSRTCIEKVLVNLHAVNADLNAVTDRVDEVESDIEALRAELHAESARLENEIRNLARLTRREGVIRRLRDLYLAKELHPWSGPLLGAALYMGAVHWQFTAEDDKDLLREEWMATVIVARGQVPQAASRLPDLLLSEAAQLPTAALEPAAYLLSRANGPAAESLSALVRRRLAGLPVDTEAAEDAVAIVRSLGDPDGCLSPRVWRPADLTEQLAQELLGATTEGGR